jgi:hypothetical protein
MPMMRLGGLDISSGRAKFQDAALASSSRSSRIYVRVAVSGMEEPFLALLDTGAEYSVLDREIAEEIGLTDAEGQTITVSHRYGSCGATAPNSGATKGDGVPDAAPASVGMPTFARRLFLSFTSNPSSAEVSQASANAGSTLPHRSPPTQ